MPLIVLSSAPVALLLAAQVHPEYPGYPYAESIKPSEWLTATTIDGCRVYFTNFKTTQAAWRRLQIAGKNRFTWSGSACTAGKPISGQGTLEEYRVLEDTTPITVRRTGELRNGYWTGSVTVSSKMGSGAWSKPQTESYHGGLPAIVRAQPNLDDD